jgi:hypothetical protein
MLNKIKNNINNKNSQNISIDITKYSVNEIINIIKNNEYIEFDINNVEVCKDCEYRYCCVTNINRKWLVKRKTFINLEECNYNPYICKWKGENGYRNLAECGVISNEHEFSIDHNKIAEINRELWEEE